jgi:hypothetical protein
VFFKESFFTWNPKAYGNGQSARSQTADIAQLQDQGPGPGRMPAEARRMYARLHDDAEEAELGPA